MSELRNLESSVIAAVAKTDREKGLLSLTKDYYLTKKLTEFSLTEMSGKNTKAVKAVSPAEAGIQATASLKSSADWIPAAAGMTTLKPFEDFYRAATRRNKTMAAKMVDRLLASNVDTGLLLAGGFHTQGLLEELKKRGLTVLTMSPKITQMGDGLSSVEVLASGRLPLDRLFTGERLFIPGSARDGNAAASGGADDARPTAEAARKVTNGAGQARPPPMRGPVHVTNNCSGGTRAWSPPCPARRQNFLCENPGPPPLPESAGPVREEILAAVSTKFSSLRTSSG